MGWKTWFAARHNHFPRAISIVPVPNCDMIKGNESDDANIDLEL